MARRRYRRFYKRKAHRWSPNIRRISGGGIATETASFGEFVTIAQNNSTTSPSSVSQLFTVKNIEVSAQVEGTGSLQNIEYYIMYIPEGYPQSLTLPEDHTEWIMAYKYLGTPVDSTGTVSGASNSNAQPPKVRTRLARKLNPGDSIVFMMRGYNPVAQQDVNYHGLIHWWTKSN